jgi:Membrane bound O-acyl transferase family
MFGIFVTTSFRFIDTTSQIKSTPPFKNDDPAYIPSCIGFVLSNTLSGIICYTSLDVLSIYYPALDPAHELLIPHPSSLTISSLQLRLLHTLKCWTGLYLFQHLIHDLFALFSASLYLNTPADWRPLFGSPLDAYSVARFWGVFSHQLHAHKLSSLSSFLVFGTLKLKPRTQLLRLALLASTFMISGLMHLDIDLTAGISMKDSGAMRFFCLEAVGIFLGGVVTKVYRSTMPRSRGGRVVERIFGRAWVAVWLAWLTPGYYYPLLRVVAKRGGFEQVTYSVINRQRVKVMVP